MALESLNNVSSLEELQVGDSFQLTQDITPLCIEQGCFVKDDIIHITNRTEKSNKSDTIGISFINTRGDNSQPYVLSLGVFISNFDQKLIKIDEKKPTEHVTEDINQQVSNLM